MLIRTIASEPRLAEKSLRGGAEMVRQGGMDAILPVLIHEMLPGVYAPQPTGAGRVPEAGHEGGLGRCSRRWALALAKDHVYPIAIARTMHQRISNSTLEIIPDAAYAAIFEARDRSADLILRWAGQMM